MPNIKSDLSFKYGLIERLRKYAVSGQSVNEATYKMYRNEDTSTATIAESEMNDLKVSGGDTYNGKTHLILETINVDKEERNNGIAKEFTRLAVSRSKDKGCQGRLGLTASTALEPLTPLIYFQSGWRTVNIEKAKQLKQHIKSGAKTGYESFKGPMYLPKRQIKKYLNRKPIAEQEY